MVNRVGDIGLAIAMMVMFAYIGSISFAGVFAAAPDLRRRARSPRSG